MTIQGLGLDLKFWPGALIFLNTLYPGKHRGVLVCYCGIRMLKGSNSNENSSVREEISTRRARLSATCRLTRIRLMEHDDPQLG